MNEKKPQDANVDNMILELRRGVLILAVLSQLEQEEYGYTLVKNLEEKGLEIEQSTVYPLLRRLESKGLLDSEWKVDGSRPRRYYVISPYGKEIFNTLKQEWHVLVNTMLVMFGDEKQGA